MILQDNAPGVWAGSFQVTTDSTPKISRLPKLNNLCWIWYNSLESGRCWLTKSVQFLWQAIWCHRHQNHYQSMPHALCCVFLRKINKVGLFPQKNTQIIDKHLKQHLHRNLRPVCRRILEEVSSSKALHIDLEKAGGKRRSLTLVMEVFVWLKKCLFKVISKGFYYRYMLFLVDSLLRCSVCFTIVCIFL